tara:strand:- start:89 stop:598 length:510 start_codon:yes stop_codon:yes gene_type:complete
MAGFQTKTFLKYDDYMTPRSAWEAINKYLPKSSIIWEAFYGDGTSGSILRDLGCFTVLHEPIDFFENDRGQVIISNPPFTMKKEVFTRLKELDKPFIIICPSSMINTQYIRNLFSDTDHPLQIIIPRKRIQFIKMINGVIDPDQKRCCNFDCFYYCWKMNMERDITWLE